MPDPSFPILIDHDFRGRTAPSLRQIGSCLSCVGVPTEMLREHLEQCYSNHGEGIEQLARRGGLAADECLAVLEGRPWLPVDDATAQSRLVRVVLDWQGKQRHR